MTLLQSHNASLVPKDPVGPSRSTGQGIPVPFTFVGLTMGTTSSKEKTNFQTPRNSRYEVTSPTSPQGVVKGHPTSPLSVIDRSGSQPSRLGGANVGSFDKAYLSTEVQPCAPDACHIGDAIETEWKETGDLNGARSMRARSRSSVIAASRGDLMEGTAPRAPHFTAASSILFAHRQTTRKVVKKCLLATSTGAIARKRLSLLAMAKHQWARLPTRFWPQHQRRSLSLLFRMTRDGGKGWSPSSSACGMAPLRYSC